jgi:hypothetical protein
MNLPPSIVGTWRLPSVTAEGKEEFMHIGEDGRIVHFVCQDASGSRLIPMALWAQSFEGDRYQIRIHPDREGWTVGMIPTPGGMIIDREEKQFHLVPASASEVPDWYPQKLENALVRMSERAAGPPPASSARPSD